MNCTECRDNLVARIEGLLDDTESLQCQAHLETCAACRAEYAALTNLHQRLVARGQSAADVSLVDPVMRRIRAVHVEPEKDTIMSLLRKHRWGFGLGATAAATAVILITLFSPSKIQAAAIEVMTNGAKAAANLTSIHLRGRLRTAPQDNFSYINPDMDFYPVELWKQFGTELKWRVDKPGRLAVMDGQSTVLYIKPANYGLKLPQAAPSAFDTQWLHEMADVSRSLNDELAAIKAHGWAVTLAQQQGADSSMKSVVTVEAKSGIADSDYLKNKFFHTADTRRVYVFDNQSQRLESVSVYLHTGSGEKLIFDLEEIDYDQPIDPAVFQPQLPGNVNWQQEMPVLPDNAKYAAMTPEQAARAFFEACGREDWNEVGKFWTMTADTRLQQYLGGLTVVSIGESYTSALYPGQFVPYEIRFKNGEVKKFNLALKKDAKTGRWYVDGGV